MRLKKGATAVAMRIIKVCFTEDLIAALDEHKGNLEMDRSAFASYLLRKGFASIGVTADDIRGAADRQRAKAAAGDTDYPEASTEDE